jgi:hypothetical protein
MLSACMYVGYAASNEIKRWNSYVGTSKESGGAYKYTIGHNVTCLKEDIR